jgi:hypothetical protein
MSSTERHGPTSSTLRPWSGASQNTGMVTTRFHFVTLIPWMTLSSTSKRIRSTWVSEQGSFPREPFTGGLEWYERYEARTKTDGVEGRLVSMYRYAKSWESWVGGVCPATCPIWASLALPTSGDEVGHPLTAPRNGLIPPDARDLARVGRRDCRGNCSSRDRRKAQVMAKFVRCLPQRYEG